MQYIFLLLVGLSLMDDSFAQDKKKARAYFGLKGNVRYAEQEKSDPVSGTLTEKWQFDKEGTIIYHGEEEVSPGGLQYKRDFFYKYNSEGRVISRKMDELELTLNQKYTKTELYQYDNVGNRTTVGDKNVHQFDRSGNAIESITFYYPGDKMIEKNKYEGMRLVEKNVYDSTGRHKSKFVYRYNNNGDKEAEEGLTSKSTPYTYSYTYTYDDQKNWVIRTTSMNDVQKSTVKRTIRYY